jgi:uncharacterized repeat protein (TIGR01451 family)
MKKFYLLFAVVLFCVSGSAQIINFLDANFKAKLLLASPSNTIARIYLSGSAPYVTIDTNNNGEIEVSEAALINALDVSNSNISSVVGIEYFTSLKGLTCHHNQIASLTLNGADINGIFQLDCSYNQLTTFDFSTIQYHYLSIDCSYNQIASLNPSQMAGQLGLNCSNNPLTSINFENYYKLEGLGCDNTLLTSLDISGNNQCESLQCSNNPNLVSLLIKDAVDIDADMGDMWFSFAFNNNPNLRYLCVSESRLGQAQAKLNQYGYTYCALSSYCDFNPGVPFYTISGTNLLDLNNNGCGVEDSLYPNLKFSIFNWTMLGTFSSSGGDYSISVLTGTHTITPIFENPSYFSASPSSITATFPTQASPFNQNFCITPNGVHNDLEISTIPIDNARPGFNSTYKIIYKNKGTQTQSGTISFAFNEAVLDFVNANPTVSSQAINALNWNFTDLQPFESREITMTLNANSPMEIPPVNGGDIFNFNASINSSLTDETPGDNAIVLNQTVVNSFDPNDKTCLQGNTITPEMVGKDVHYLIRFENTGTANAENVVVKDMIDTEKFDINSLIPIDGSHPFVTRINNTNKVEFIFENINLPFDDANNDGYVAFKIKTKPTLVVGDYFSNTANIYFDYNFPIITDPAVTTVALLANSDFEFENYFNIYPNPANDVLNIETKQTISVTSINIYNTLGQIILVIPNAQQTQSVDVSTLKTGNYFLKINSDRGSSSVKFVKM